MATATTGALAANRVNTLNNPGAGIIAGAALADTSAAAGTLVAPNGYQAAQLTSPTQWAVTPEQTVQGQLATLADPNNPNYQSWATAGKQVAAANGFTGNSTMRDTGILNSVIQNATPIATADASTEAKAAGYNADQSNQFATTNVNAQNAALANKYASDMNAANIRQTSANALQNTQYQMQMETMKENNATKIQNSTNAATAYNNFVSAVNNIQNNTGLSSEGKQNAIEQQQTLYQNSLSGLDGAFSSGVPNVSSWLTFAPTTTTGSATGATWTPDHYDYTQGAMVNSSGQQNPNGQPGAAQPYSGG
jgi:hypothetical protein